MKNERAGAANDGKPAYTVLDFSGAIQTAKCVMRQKQQWEQRKVVMMQQLREAAKEDINEWEIPAE